MITSKKNRQIGTNGGVKKMVINFKVGPSTVPKSFKADTWVKLREAIQAIHNQQSTKSNLEELYNDVKNLCSNQNSKELFSDLKEELNSHICQMLKKLTEERERRGTPFLESLHKVWETHSEQMKMIRRIFLYLDRTFVLHSTSSRSIWNLGLELFQEHLLAFQLIGPAIDSVLEMIKKERQGEAVSWSILQSVVGMMVSLDLYSCYFEHPFLRETKDFYRREGRERIDGMEVSEYIRDAERRLGEEGKRVVQYLDGATKKSLLKVVNKQLLFRHLETILKRGFDKLMKSHQLEDLGLLYRLFPYSEGRIQIRDYFKEYVKSRGSQIVSDQEKDPTMVQEVLEFKRKLDEIIRVSFAGNEDFGYGLREGFEYFMNIRENRPSELVAKFVDSKLRTGGSKSISEQELEQMLNDVLIIFRYINGKDVFEAFYKKDLAKRLLLGRSASIDGEKLMISRLRAECGAAFTAKLEGMFKDVDLSKDLVLSFKQTRAGVEMEQQVDLNVFVLTMGFWPPYPALELHLNSLMTGYLETFKKFYFSKHSSRRLSWQHSLGHCILKVIFPKAGKKELSVSLFQAVVLLLFNENTALKYNEIKDKVGLDDKELRSTLQSLSVAKIRPLSKTPMSRDVKPDDSFSLNVNFKNPLFRIKINQIQAKETKAERQKTNDSVFVDRQYQIDAAVVRIMKTRKTLKHNLLITELCSQLKFPLQMDLVKKRLESLIEKEFIELDEENSQV